MLKQVYLSLPCNTKLERVSCSASLTLIILTTSWTVVKDMKSTFQYLFDVPVCYFDPSSKTVMQYEGYKCLCQSNNDNLLLYKVSKILCKILH